MDKRITINSIMDDFYIILPSNSCPLTQPNNNASQFIVDWENALELQGNWEAALTEFMYCYKPLQIQKDTSISLTEYRELAFDKTWFQLSRKVETPIKENQKNLRSYLTAKIGSKNLDYTFDEQNGHTCFVLRQPSKYIIEFRFKSLEEAKLFGFNNQFVRINPGDVRVISDLPYDTKSDKNMNDIRIDIQIIDDNSYRASYPFSENIVFDNINEMTSYIKKSLKLKSFKVNKDGKLNIEVNDGTTEISFPTYLKEIFNLNNNVIDTRKNKTFTCSNKVTIPMSKVEQLYIYSSLTDPVYVGGQRLQLLRTMPINTKFQNGDTFSKIIEKPMYIPVSSTNINNIEVNIRDDFGRLITFAYGSKAILTIHLRKRYG